MRSRQRAYPAPMLAAAAAVTVMLALTSVPSAVASGGASAQSAAASGLGPASPAAPGAGARPRERHPRRRHHRRHHTPRHGRAGGVALSVRHDGRMLTGLARAASAFSDSIVDFSFSPATLTIHVGDTVTWTNVGQAPHSATANDSSFNTGILKHGQSASHTFTTPGTYSYYCLVHPYMKATIVVLASNTSGGGTGSGTGSGSGAGAGSGSGSGSGGGSGSGAGSGSGSASGTGAGSGSSSGASSGSSLPMTGIDLGGLVLCGLALTAAGAALRRRLSS